MIEVDEVLGVTGDKDVWARQLATQKKGKVTAADLEEAITDIVIRDTMQGSSTIELTVGDENWQLIDSGFFDTDSDGRLDPIDVNYPDGSRFWWRLTQVSLDDTSGPMIVTMTFMERAAAHMMAHHGPLKISRGKKTRAEAMRMLTSKVKAGGGIRFHSEELHKKQQIAKGEVVSAEKRRREKRAGINPNEDVKIKGVTATKQQLHHVEVALDEAYALNAPERAVMAMLVAGIGESDFRDVVNSKGYGGVFQGRVAVMDGKAPNWFAGMKPYERTKAQAHYFLKGGNGYNEGGAIHLVTKNPDMSPGEVATRVETSGKPGSFYQDHTKEAEALLSAYGGASFGGVTYRKQYNFEVGSRKNPRETYWDAANRWAREVNWAFFLDGQDAYYDSEMTLIKQRPVHVVKRGDPAIVGFSCDWDGRQIATEATLTLICDPFEFRAGEVFKLQGYGPASTGTTAKHPGRWLIASSERRPTDLATTFTLKQPTRPNPEPAAATGTRKESAAANAGAIKGSPKWVIDNVVLPLANECGVSITPEQNDAANRRHSFTTTTGNRSDHSGPPSERWAADMSNGFRPTPEMDKLAKELAKLFKLTPLNLKVTGAGGSSQSSSGNYKNGPWVYRIQLIYRSTLGGNHDNHVHLGIALLSAPPKGEAWHQARIPGSRLGS